MTSHQMIDRTAMRILVATAICVATIQCVSAATAPALGSIASSAIVSSTFTNSNTSPQTILNGDICYSTVPVTPPLTTTGTTTTPCAPQAGIDQGLALADLNGQQCTSLGAGAVALDSITVGANPPGVFPPGCYTSGGAMNVTVSTTVRLTGSGVFVFRPGGALNTDANSSVILANGACAANVFWAPVGSATLGANSSLSASPTFVGTIIDAAGITIGHFANLGGRALAFGGTVTTDAVTIGPVACAPLNPGLQSGVAVPALGKWTMAALVLLIAFGTLLTLRRNTRRA